MGFFSTIFGNDNVVKKGMELIDEAFYTDEERAEDRVKLLEKKSNIKLEQLKAYHPYKVTQRFIALSFIFVFLFIMLNGILSQLYGLVDMENVKNALNFANQMWLGEIVLIIVTFYFGGGTAEGVLERMKGDKNE